MQLDILKTNHNIFGGGNSWVRQYTKTINNKFPTPCHETYAT